MKIDTDLIAQALRKHKIPDAQIPAIVKDCEAIAKENKAEPGPKEDKDMLQYYAVAVVPAGFDTSKLEGISCYVFQGGAQLMPQTVEDKIAAAALRYNEQLRLKKKGKRKNNKMPVRDMQGTIETVRNKVLWYTEQELDAETHLKPLNKHPFTILVTDGSKIEQTIEASEDRINSDNE